MFNVLVLEERRPEHHIMEKVIRTAADSKSLDGLSEKKEPDIYILSDESEDGTGLEVEY